MVKILYNPNVKNSKNYIKSKSNINFGIRIDSTLLEFENEASQIGLAEKFQKYIEKYGILFKNFEKNKIKVRSFFSRIINSKKNTEQVDIVAFVTQKFPLMVFEDLRSQKLQEIFLKDKIKTLNKQLDNLKRLNVPQRQDLLPPSKKLAIAVSEKQLIPKMIGSNSQNNLQEAFGAMAQSIRQKILPYATEQQAQMFDYFIDLITQNSSINFVKKNGDFNNLFKAAVYLRFDNSQLENLNILLRENPAILNFLKESHFLPHYFKPKNVKAFPSNLTCENHILSNNELYKLLNLLLSFFIA